MIRLQDRLAAAFFAAALSATSADAGSRAQIDRTLIQRDLTISPRGAAPLAHLRLADAMRILNIPSASVALISNSRIAFSDAFGGAGPQTLYQAASLSKLVTAVAALRLAAQGRLGLDRDVDAELTSWRLPENAFTRGRPVTLRGLLSMTGGVGVPGYPGYGPGTPLPSLAEILDGAPPANSPPVRVVDPPGSRYAYSGGGYEIVQALIEDATHRSFPEAMKELVLAPAGMTDSFFEQPPSEQLRGRAAAGHYADGAELPGRWRVIPELAAGGLWTNASDLAKLLIEIGRAYRGEKNPLLDQAAAKDMLTRQNGGPYGLGGAVEGAGRDVALMKRGQNIGYQGYMLIFPQTGQGLVVLTGSDNGSTLATALIKRAAAAFHWPPLGALPD
jgi:CubicO group peptidase (beta-lactamase class C family)